MNVALYKEAQRRLPLGEVPASQRAVLKEIISCVKKGEDLFYGSILDLAQWLGRHKTDVRADVFALRDRGFLVVVEQHKGKPTKYRVCLDGLPTTWADVAPRYSEVNVGSDSALPGLYGGSGTWADVAPTMGLGLKTMVKPASVVDPIQMAWNYYREQISDLAFYTFTPQRKKIGAARFAEALSITGGNAENAIQLMKHAIDAMRDSDWHNGKNHAKRKYNGWENIFGTPERFQNWLKRAQESE
jgi:hypothetical protein